MGFYLAGFFIFVASDAFPGDVFARYILGFTPFFILFLVRGSRNWGKWAWAYSIAALTILAGFSVLALADRMDHMNVRWQAALWADKELGPVYAGFDWENWGHVSGDEAHVVDMHEAGYTTQQ